MHCVDELSTQQIQNKLKIKYKGSSTKLIDIRLYIKEYKRLLEKQ